MSTILTGVTDSSAGASGLTAANEMRQMLVDRQTHAPRPEPALPDGDDREINSRVTTSLPLFELNLYHRMGGQPFTVHQILGYSGAGYADNSLFDANFRESVVLLNQQTLANFGSSAKTVFILGGTVDGFGRGYKIIRELQEQGLLKNVIVAGMTSNQAVAFHKEGLEKGWGDTLSPLQDIFYLKQTFRESSGHATWELKSSPQSESDTAKILKDMSRLPGCGPVTFSVFGGGVQAFNEAMELILEARHRPHEVDLNLFLGLLPGKPVKDTGYRAADLLAYVLAQHPELLAKTTIVRVSMNGQTIPIAQYHKTQEFRAFSETLQNAAKKLAELKLQSQSPEVSAQIRSLEVLENLDQLPLTEIEQFYVRSSEALHQARRKILNPHYSIAEPASYEAFLAQADVCQDCQADAESLKLQLSNGGSRSCEGFFHSLAAPKIRQQ